MPQQVHDQEYGWGTVLLGMCYQFGRGVKKNSDMVAEIYRTVAAKLVGDESNVGNASYLLACCYARGEGVEKNYDAAVELLQEVIKIWDYKHKYAKNRNMLKKTTAMEKELEIQCDVVFYIQIIT